MGCDEDGIKITAEFYNNIWFTNAPADPIDRVVLNNIKSRYNDKAGVLIRDCDDLRIIGGDYSNNGQDSALSAALRVGILESSGGTIGSVYISPETTCYDTQSGTLTDFASIDFSTYTGAFTAGDEIQFYCLRASDLHEGQVIDIDNIQTGPADVRVKIKTIKADIVTAVIVTASGTYAETLTAGTGTLSSSGTTLTGSGTAFTTQITGNTWIKSDSEYRMITRVVSDTSAYTYPIAFTGLSGDSFEISQHDIILIASQNDNVVMSSATISGMNITSSKINTHTIHSRYSFNPGYTDGSANANDLSAAGAPVLTNGHDNRAYSAYYFDGSDDNLYIANADRSTEPDTDFYVSLWIKPATSTADTYPIYAWLAAGDQRSFYVMLKTDNSICFAVSGEGTAATSHSVTSTLTCPDGQWTHVLCVLNDTTDDIINVYINGVGTTPVSHSTGIHQGTGNWDIAGVSGAFFNGTIDDIVISSSEISEGDILHYTNSGDDFCNKIPSLF